MTIDEFIKNNKVTLTFNRITEADIPHYEELLGVKIGPQMRAYLLNYGLLMYKYVRFFNINTVQGDNSDMVDETVFIHKQFPKTQGLIAFEDQGDGDYYLVDSEDRVYNFLDGNNEIVDTGLTLNEYILKRFESVQL